MWKPEEIAVMLVVWFTSGMKERQRRLVFAVTMGLSLLAGIAYEAFTVPTSAPQTLGAVTQTQMVASGSARETLDMLSVKGRAPKTGYERSLFSNGWGEVNGCSVRELILKRDLTEVQIDEDGCRVLSGKLADQYSANMINFKRGATTSQAVQIDHVVAVSDAWQKGAQQLSSELRNNFYNDPLNLIAVDGPTNNDKGDADAASWLPPNKDFRCRYVARQIAVKKKYSLWVTEAEQSAMKKVLGTCPDQQLPIVSSAV